MTITAIMGSDLSIVNAARASRGTVSKKWTQRDADLMHFLAHPDGEAHPHESPFRHAIVRIEFETSIRQRLMIQDLTYDAGMVFRPTMNEFLQGTSGPYPAMENYLHNRWTASVDALLRWCAAAQDTNLERWANHQVLEPLADYFPYAVTERNTLGWNPGIPGSQYTYTPPEERSASFMAGTVTLVDYLDGPTPDESVLQFRIEAPLMVRAQWFKYVRRGDNCPSWLYEAWEEGSGNGDDGGIGADPLGARNERSWRIDHTPEFYTPTEWRRQNPDNKQGDNGEPIDPVDAKHLTRMLREVQENLTGMYNHALGYGVATEQARLFLPANGLMTSWVWTASVSQVAHLLDQREHASAQKETRDAAAAIRLLGHYALPQYIAGPF